MTEEQGTEESAPPVKKPWKDPMDDFQRPMWVAIPLILWVAICIVVQYGWLAGVAWYLILAFALGALLGFGGSWVVLIRAFNLSPLAAVVYLVPVAVWLVAGWYNAWRDALLYIFLLLVAVLTSAASAGLVERVGQWAPGSKRLGGLMRRWGLANKPPSKSWQLGHALLFLVVLWSLTSLGDHLSGPQWSLQRSLLGRQRTAVESAPRPTEPTIGLALSGGGFRAALVHAGVIAALNEERVTVRAVSSVSGGSIVAGAFVMGARPEEFKQAVASRRFNLRRDLVNVHNLVRLPFPASVGAPVLPREWQLNLLPFGYEFSRISVLQKQLDRVLFGGLRLVSDARDQDPLWLIGATDLLSGDAVGITRFGVYRRGPSSVDIQVADGHLPRGHLPRSHSKSVFNRFFTASLEPDSVSYLVAASSAFPGAFPHLPVRYREQKGSPQIELRLADGGLTDNSGLALLLAAWQKPPPEWWPREADKGVHAPFDVVIASNAGRRLDPLAPNRPFLTPVRALDIVYASSGVFVTEEEALKDGGPMVIPLDPAQALPESVSWVRSLLEAVEDDGRIDQAEAHATLSKELPERLLRRLRRTIPDTGLHKQLGQNWESVEKVNAWLEQDERTNEQLRVVLDVHQAAEAFERTSTLDDLLPREDVEALFRLGQYLVQLNWTHIETALNRTPSTK